MQFLHNPRLHGPISVENLYLLPRSTEKDSFAGHMERYSCRSHSDEDINQKTCYVLNVVCFASEFLL